MDRRILIFTAIGFECVALVGGFILIGRWLDTKYGWNDIGAAMGAILGTAAWFIHLVMLFKQLNKPQTNSGANSAATTGTNSKTDPS